jgi:DNA polymerase I
MQANGAEMLRLACCLATENGIEVCAPIHDAVLIAAPLNRIENDVARTQAFMAEASRVVLGGFELRTEAKIVKYPDRFIDNRGVRMWGEVWALIEELEVESIAAE